MILGDEREIFWSILMRLFRVQVDLRGLKPKKKKLIHERDECADYGHFFLFFF